MGQSSPFSTHDMLSTAYGTGRNGTYLSQVDLDQHVLHVDLLAMAFFADL